MRRWNFKMNTISLISALLAVCVIVSWAWSYSVDPRKDCLSFGPDFHIAVQNGRVSFFNNKECGPYRGSIIALTASDLPVERIFSEQRCFGDMAGIYYRYFRWADSGQVLWTLSVSLIYLLIVFLVLPVAWGWKRWRGRGGRALSPAGLRAKV